MVGCDYPSRYGIAVFSKSLSIVIAMAFIPDQRQPLMLGVVSLIVLMIAFGVRYTYGKPPTLMPGAETKSLT